MVSVEGHVVHMCKKVLDICVVVVACVYVFKCLRLYIGFLF